MQILVPVIFFIFILNHRCLFADVYGIYGLTNYLGNNLPTCNLDITLCGNQPTDHIMCNQMKRESTNCTNFELFEMNGDLKMRILLSHNGLRHLEAKRFNYEIPNMNQVYWDDHLAYMAEQFVFRCPTNGTQHNCYFIGDEWHTIGQNFYYESKFYGCDRFLDVAIRSWMKWDFRDKDWYEKAKKYPETTQILWPSTKFIGCAGARVTDGTLFVCYYGPRGNIGSIRKAFMRGQSCTACPIGSYCSDVFPGLCDELSNAGFVVNRPFSYEILFAILFIWFFG